MDPRGWKRQQSPLCGRVIEVLQSRGVSVNGCFILGLDNHTPEIFPTIWTSCGNQVWQMCNLQS